MYTKYKHCELKQHKNKKYQYTVHLLIIKKITDPPQDHCGKCRIRTWDLCPRSLVSHLEIML